jgi:ureidoglycolate lyase
MNTGHLIAAPLTAEAFRRFGDVIDAAGSATMMINDARCERFHDLARLEFAGGKAGISIFRSKASALPYQLELMERHPAGSQAFLPMGGRSYLVVVAEDAGGRPGDLYAFLAGPEQGVNYLAGTWHAPLIALDDDAVFAVVDRIGSGDNLDEHRLAAPVSIALP